MNESTSAWRAELLRAAVLVFGIGGCAAPEFVSEGTFARPLKEFERIDVRVPIVALEKVPTYKEQSDWARQFAGEFRTSVVHRLHRWNVLDALEGPALVLEVRILKYEWEFDPGSSDSPPRATSRIGIAVLFKDEEGKKLGSGNVAATDIGGSPRSAMERSEKRVIASVYKFIRKSVGRKVEKDLPEPPELEISPSR